ncbi:MAG TPA: PA14 domain-containing protein [Candidatus Paceibacterota bacterium]|nr:PA14 domain-containing protein [Verrucomicrobiota bacterium]HRY50140.1 PA14 domain-containing protein [Candidatus Paceibacterota bacterium]HSA00144.1 PA14 domain-containing protein [Candidatus Paceibacterota bacterium]
MKYQRLKALLSLMLISGLGAYAAAPPTAQGLITGKAFLNISGTAVTDLTSNAKFPDKPDVVHYYPYFEWNAGGDINVNPAVYSDNYGGQIAGYFYPPATGDYIFFVSSDDGGNLYLSTDDTAANKKLIAQEAGWSNARMWESIGGTSTVEAKNSSTFTGTQWPTKDTVMGGAQITLTQGRAYYIEALFKDGTGGDYLAVAVAAPDGSIDQTLPIPGQYLSTIDKQNGPITFMEQPKTQSVVEGTDVVFSVEVNGTPPYVYQWMRDGVDIADGTNRTYTVVRAPLSENGKKFSCKVTGGQNSATSDTATLTVTADLDMPTIVYAKGSPNFVTVTVSFSKPMDKTSAETIGNYSIAPSLAISAATLEDLTNVVLTTAKQAVGAEYTVTVNNVKDDTAAGHVIAANSKWTFKSYVMAQGVIVREVWTTLNSISALKTAIEAGTPPDVVTGHTAFEAPSNFAENYAQRMSGWLIPPTTGSYIFFVASDDGCELYISTDDSPANLGTDPIARISTWVGSREWNGGWTADGGNREIYNNNNAGAPIDLVGGKSYYVEVLMNEGTSGDNLAVGWVTPGKTVDVNIEPPDVAAVELIPGSALAGYLDPGRSSLTITKHPQSITVLENQTGMFSVLAEATSEIGSVISYQWQKNGADIAGATGASYTIPPAATSDNGAKFRCKLLVPALDPQFSDEAILTVSSDITPPVVKGAAVLKGSNKIGVSYDGLMDASAGQASNYQLVGGTVTAATLRPDGMTVELTVSGLTGTEFTLNISGVKDKIGNPIAAGTSFKGKILNVVAQDIGNPGTDPLEPGSTFPVGERDFDMISGGSDYWNNADGFHFAYEERTGDFDMVVQVAYIDRKDNWTHGGLMARESLAAGSRYVNAVINPDASQSGANLWEMNYRAETDGAAAGVPNYTQVGPLPYPNVWVRLQRVGDVFTGYRGTNGVDWSKMTEITLDYPDKIYVGMASTAHNNAAGQAALTKYRNYGPYPYVPPVTEEGANIAWISFHPADNDPAADAKTAGFTEASDVGYTKLLASKGHKVTRFVTSGTPDVAKLNTYDLVIISRSVPSGDYQDPPETLAWNGITAPTMVLGGYVIRNSRLGYTTGGTIPDTAGAVKLSIKSPGHPIFDGIALDAGNTMVNNYANLMTFADLPQRGISVNSDPVAGGGTILATIGTAGDPAVNGMVIGEWVAGAKMATAAGDILGGHRLVFLTGSRERDGLTSQGSGIFDLTDDGAKMFLNAVKYMAAPPVTAPEFTSITRGADGKITVTWEGGGTLQAAEAITGPWQDVPGATSPYTLTPTSNILFGRIKK